jgi:1-acyl-sn-glycerol-3-phosphate acyltransferase
MTSLRAAWRLLLAILHALGGLATIALRFPRLGEAAREARVQAWSLQMLALLNVRLEVKGDPPAGGPVLLVANHISWLDILVMHAARYCRFVSKADVRQWPVIGTLATGGGTIYIERESRRDAMRVVHAMADSLRRGEVVAVFPEGTTGDGIELLPFHANMIQAAIAADAPAQPVALSFLDATTGAASRSPSYVGDETLLGSVWRTLSGPPIVAVVHYGAAQRPLGRSRREWAAQLRSAVSALRERG